MSALQLQADQASPATLVGACVGIDVSKAKLDVAVRWRVASPGQREPKPLHKQVSNDARGFARLHKWLQAQVAHEAIERVGLEASGRYGEALAYFLVEHDYPVSYINPKLIHAFGKMFLHRSKTDKQDALLIAHFCELHRPDLFRPASELFQVLQQRARRLKALQKMRQMECNRLQSGITDELVLAQIRAAIAYFDQLIQCIQAAIDELFAQHDELAHDRRLLVSIKGIGKKTATLLLAELGDIRRFDSPRQLAAFIGITPLQVQSGTSVRKPGEISKEGNARIRAGLYMPAVVAKRWNKPCRQLAQRLEAKRKPGNVVVIAVMRKLVHQVHGILKSGLPFDPNFENSA